MGELIGEYGEKRRLTGKTVFYMLGYRGYGQKGTASIKNRVSWGDG